MEEQNPEVPPHESVPLKVAIAYNLKSSKKSDIPDEEAEYDSIDTVLALKASLEKNGHSVILLEDDGNFTEKAKKSDADIVFNIAEGRGGRGREGFVPTILDYCGIPYTGSDGTALCVALDKMMTKKLVSAYGVRTPRSVLVCAGDTFPKAELDTLTFPLIVKPNAEGSGKGISEVSIVQNRAELNDLLAKNIGIYHSDMLAEEYIDGGEFTVGIIGNGADTKVFSPMEIAYRRHTQGDFNVYSYNVKKNYREFVDYVCPSHLCAEKEAEMIDFTKKVYDAFGCRDFSRVDFRTDKNGDPYFIEINPLPGLAPSYSDYPILAEFCGVSYDALINAVLDAARKRLGI